MTETICKRCSHKWNYKGHNNVWTTCPNCKTSVKLAFFVHKEKTLIDKIQAELDYMEDRFNSLHSFILEKNPQLLEDWTNFLIKKSQQIANQEADGFFSEIQTLPSINSN